MLKKEREQISFIQKTLVVRKGEYTISINKHYSYYYLVYKGKDYKLVSDFWHRIPKELWLDNFHHLDRNLPDKYSSILSSFLSKLPPETLLDKEEWQHLTLKEVFDSLDTVKRLNGKRD